MFEAPIDMLSFITMNKRDWKRQNYVTLDGVTEHAMLWVLSQNPQISKVRLCLDHDPAGIEAVSRLTEILAGKGYTDIATLQSVNKDWNDDRKAQLGYNSEPSKENPKVEMFRAMCNELAGVCDDINPKDADIEKEVDTLNRLAQAGKYSHAQTVFVNIYTFSLVSAADQMKRIENPVTAEQLAEKMAQEYAPHRDRGGMRSRCDYIVRLFKLIQEQEKSSGIRTTTEREKEIKNYISLACEGVKAISFLVLEKQKQEQKSGTITQSMIM